MTSYANREETEARLAALEAAVKKLQPKPKPKVEMIEALQKAMVPKKPKPKRK